MNQGSFSIQTAFAVPMVLVEHPSPQPLNEQLMALFTERAGEGERFSNPDKLVLRKNLFESRFNLFDWPQPPVQQLKQFCMQHLYRAIGELNNYDMAMLKQLQVQLESWFHLTEKGGFFGVHNHVMHSWSGVYCVRHDGDDPNSDSGQLRFHHPNPEARMFSDKTITNMQPPFRLSSRTLRLAPGNLVLFPSWLQHEVLPYDGDSLRVTVAFNARFRLAGVQPPDNPVG